MNTTLYAKDVSGVIRVWSIVTTSTGLIIEHGVYGGSMQHKVEKVVPKGNRTMDEQIKARYYSRCNRQFDKGYVETLDEAQLKGRTNAIGMKRPMLAQAKKHVKDIDYQHAYYQHKYDGNRCLITKQGGKVTAYSRNGKPVTSIKHITDSMKLYEGQTIDGELYCHGIPLQTINSWVKREQKATLNLQMRVYDCMMNESYANRLGMIINADLGKNAFFVDTHRIHNEEEAMDLFKRSLKEGYEGGIIRWGLDGYEDGKRSKSLVKLKMVEDAEFIIVDIIPSVDGWARLECETNEGDNFMVSAPGSLPERHAIMDDFEQHLGRLVTVEYAYMTKDGIPFHPVAKAFRDDL